MSEGISFSFFHWKVTGLKSFIKSKPTSSSCISSFNLISEGAVIDVAPKAIFESEASFPIVKLLLAAPVTVSPITIWLSASVAEVWVFLPIKTQSLPVTKDAVCAPASPPIQIFFAPVVIAEPALSPTQVLENPPVIATPALLPKVLLEKPVVTSVADKYPTAVLL